MNVFLERFRKFLEILCAILLIAITAVVFAQVVNRFVFHGPLPGRRRFPYT